MRHAWLILLVIAGCSRSRPAVATLVELGGAVESQRQDDAAPWKTAAQGDRYHVGDAIRTATEATARLRLARNGTLDLDPETVVRFRRTPGDHLDVGVEAGSVEIEAGELELVLETEAGAARISGGGRARFTATGGETTLEVLVGKVILETADGARELEAGMQIEFAIGGAILEDDPPPEPEPVAIDAGTEPVIAIADAGVTGAHGPTAVDVVISAGESATIHDPRPPTAVGVKFACPVIGQLEIAGKKGWSQATTTVGNNGASALLAAGTRKYRVRCGDDVIGTGRLVIQKDGARKELPRRAPRNVVDADGRKYTLLYQNRLPELVLRWPDAPSADGYEVHVASAKKDRKLDAKAARYTFASGDVPEGEHRFWFEAGGQKSPETIIQIKFDNAAAAIYLRRVDVTADKIVVEGAAIAETTVSLEGERVDLDDQHRFAASATLPLGRSAGALRIAHRLGGVHYYVLRAEGG